MKSAVTLVIKSIDEPQPLTAWHWQFEKYTYWCRRSILTCRKVQSVDIQKGSLSTCVKVLLVHGWRWQVHFFLLTPFCAFHHSQFLKNHLMSETAMHCIKFGLKSLLAMFAITCALIRLQSYFRFRVNFRTNQDRKIKTFTKPNCTAFNHSC